MWYIDHFRISNTNCRNKLFPPPAPIYGKRKRFAAAVPVAQKRGSQDTKADFGTYVCSCLSLSYFGKNTGTR